MSLISPFWECDASRDRWQIRGGKKWLVKVFRHHAPPEQLVLALTLWTRPEWNPNLFTLDNIPTEIWSSYSEGFVLKFGFTHSVMSLEYFLSNSSYSSSSPAPCWLRRSTSLSVFFHISVSVSSFCRPGDQQVKIFLYEKKRDRYRTWYYTKHNIWKHNSQFGVPHSTCRCQEQEDDAKNDECHRHNWKNKQKCISDCHKRSSVYHIATCNNSNPSRTLHAWVSYMAQLVTMVPCSSTVVPMWPL